MRYLLLILSCCSALAQLPVIPWSIPPSSSAFNPVTAFSTNLIVWFEATDAAINTGQTHPLANGTPLTNWITSNLPTTDYTNSVTTNFQVYWNNQTGWVYYTNGGGPLSNKPRVAGTNAHSMRTPTTSTGNAGTSQPLTIAYVAQNTKATGTDSGIFGYGNNDLLLRKTSAGAIQLYITASTITSGNTYTDQGYYYVVCVVTNGGSLIRTNGLQAASGSINAGGLAGGSISFYFGTQSGDAAPWQGNICRFAIWATNASPSQITNIENWCINDFGFPAHP